MSNAEKIVRIPFAGFYNSDHDSELDNAVEQMAADPETGDPVGGLGLYLMTHANWQAIHKEYAKHYVEVLAENIEAKYQFYDMLVTREYNFSTDIILVKITLEELQRLYAKLGREAVADHIRVELAPRSGFVPFYSNDINDWPADVAKWDDVQLGLILGLYVTKTVDSTETELMENFRANGRFEEWIESNTPKIDQFYNVKDYLIERKNR